MSTSVRIMLQGSCIASILDFQAGDIQCELIDRLINGSRTGVIPMERVVSATEARVRFGALLRRVVDEQEAVVVERAGRPQVVVLPIDEYARLKTAQWGDAQSALRRAQEIARHIQDRRQGRPLPPPPKK